MITEKDNVFYCDCGFSFQRGRSGAHDCADGLRNKLAESEARCAALAAENAGLKSAALEEIEVINRGGQAYCVKDGMSVNPIYARGWNDYRAKSLSVKTPDTDAYQAEVRAQGVEMFAAWNDKHIKPGVEHKESLTAVSHAARGFAAQLRQGGAVMSKLTIDLLVMDDACDPYICGVRGDCTIEELRAIEKEIVENRDDYFPTDGIYTIEASFFKGQYGEYGRCEIAPGWEWDIISFSPFDFGEEAAQ